MSSYRELISIIEYKLNGLEYAEDMKSELSQILIEWQEDHGVNQALKRYLVDNKRVSKTYSDHYWFAYKNERYI